MKTFKIESFSCGGSSGSHWEEYYSEGETLKEAKAKLVKQIGCTKDYFDDPEYTKITEVSINNYIHMDEHGVCSLM